LEVAAEVTHLLTQLLQLTFPSEEAVLVVPLLLPPLDEVSALLVLPPLLDEGSALLVLPPLRNEVSALEALVAVLEVPMLLVLPPLEEVSALEAQVLVLEVPLLVLPPLLEEVSALEAQVAVLEVPLLLPLLLPPLEKVSALETVPPAQPLRKISFLSISLPGRPILMLGWNALRSDYYALRSDYFALLWSAGPALSTRRRTRACTANISCMPVVYRVLSHALSAVRLWLRLLRHDAFTTRSSRRVPVPWRAWSPEWRRMGEGNLHSSNVFYCSKCVHE
jgi:hypothetical protein